MSAFTLKPLPTIELHEGGGASFVGRGAVEVFRLASLIGALKLEQKGLRMSRHMSALAVAKRTTGIKSNDRQLHIERIEKMLEQAKSQVLYIDASDKI